MIDLYKNDDLNSISREPIIIAHKPSENSWIALFRQNFSHPFLSTIKKWMDNPINDQDIITIHL